jgi:hypothetical protein
MNSIERACLSRVRMLALAAMARAGGTPTAWQLRRAIAPIVGDLVDAVRAQGPGAAGATAAGPASLPTVDRFFAQGRSFRARRATGDRHD